MAVYHELGLMNSRRNIHKPCPWCLSVGPFSTRRYENGAVAMGCDFCGAVGPKVRGMSHGMDDTRTPEGLALSLWDYRLHPKELVPDPKFRCIECRVKWVHSPIARCDDCLNRRANL